MAAEFEAEELGNELGGYEQTAQMLANNERIVDRSDHRIQLTLENEHIRGPDSIHSIHHVDLETDTITQSTNEDDIGTDVTELDLTVHTRTAARRPSTRTKISSLCDSIRRIRTRSNTTGGRRRVHQSGHSDSNGAIMILVSASELADGFDSTDEDSHVEVVDYGENDVLLSQNDEQLYSTYRDGTADEVIQRGRTNREQSSSTTPTKSPDTHWCRGQTGCWLRTQPSRTHMHSPTTSQRR